MNRLRLDPTAQCIRGVRELVRGREQQILEELQPLVRRKSVCLDLSRIDRIDAAGLAALVSLYCDARNAGHAFAVINPQRHVARILSIVGLDRILVSNHSRDMLPPAPPLDLVAA